MFRINRNFATFRVKTSSAIRRAVSYPPPASFAILSYLILTDNWGQLGFL